MPELRYAHVGSTTYNLRDDRLDTVEDTGAEFISRASTHDGAATIETLRGNTLVWNQYRPDGDTLNVNTSYATKSYSSGVTTATVTVANSNSQFQFTHSFAAGDVGHKYALSADMYVTSTASYSRMRVLYPAVATSDTVDVTPGAWRHIGLLFTITATTAQMRLYYDISTMLSVNDTVECKNLMFFDLTRMFGAGNEPATVAEFEALYPEAYYAYDAGTLLPVNVEGMTSTGTGWTQTRAIDATYMPLRKAGSVYDELTAGKLTRRVGVVDLGSLTWEIYNAGLHIFRATIAAYTGHNGSNNMICEPPYTCVPANTPAASLNDKEMKQTAGSLNTYPLYARDTTCSTATDITTAMNGVYLFYELETPTETTISPALNLSYRVENGGTETWEPPSGEMTAPVDADIAYGWLPVLAGYVQS